MVAAVQLREAVEHLVHHAGGKVVGADVDQRTLHRAADGGPAKGDDDWLGHVLCLRLS